MAFEYFIGGRYLRSRQKHAFISFITFLSMAGVTVGVMALIIVISVMSGAESYFKSQILGVESHVLVRRHGGAISDYRQVEDKIRKIEKVKSVEHFVYSQVILRSANGISGAVLRGIDPLISQEVIKGYNQDQVQKKLNRRPSGGAETSSTTSSSDSITRWVNRYRPLLIMTIGTLFYAVGFAMYGFVAIFPLFLVAMAIITIGEMFVSPVSQSIVARMAPEDMRGRYMAVYGFSWLIPFAIGPLMAGIVMDNFNPNWVWYAGGLICMAAVMGFLGLHLRVSGQKRFASAPASM